MAFAVSDHKVQKQFLDKKMRTMHAKPDDTNQILRSSERTTPSINEKKCRREHSILKTVFSIDSKPGSSILLFRVDYWIAKMKAATEWLDFEHDWFVGGRAADWWTERCSLPLAPLCAVDAVELAEAGYIRETLGITTRGDEVSRNEIISYRFGDWPDLYSEHTFNIQPENFKA